MKSYLDGLNDANKIIEKYRKLYVANPKNYDCVECILEDIWKDIEKLR